MRFRRWAPGSAMPGGRRGARRRATLALLALAGAALIGAGCGSNNAQIKKNNAYVDQINSAQQTFATAATTIGGLITPTSTPASDAAALRTLATTLGATATAIRSATPPSNLVSLHQQLTGEIQAYATAVGNAARKVGSETPQQETATLRQMRINIQKITSQFSSTVDAINKKLKAA
jgi:hypothetical protein